MEGALRHALCDFVSFVSATDNGAGLTVFLARASDRVAIASALDALDLLDPGEEAGDAGSWHIVLTRPSAPDPVPPPWWPTGEPGMVASRYLDSIDPARRVTVHAIGA